MNTVRTALVTGVSSGIGRLTAELMVKRGWQVAGTSRDPGLLSEWAIAQGIALFALDLTDDVSRAAVVEAVTTRFGRIDVLVNNAGYGFFAPLESASIEEIAAYLHLNLLAPIALVRHVMPVMRKQQNGIIINVSSVAGRTGAPFASLYHASKFAVEGFSESLRYEASLHNIRVKVVEPGHFRTGFVAHSVRPAEPSGYELPLRNYMEWVDREDLAAPSAEPVAQAIVRAIEDTSSKLRYPVKAAFTLALVNLLPDSLWRSLMAAGMTRRPKTSGGR